MWPQHLLFSHPSVAGSRGQGSGPTPEAVVSPTAEGRKESTGGREGGRKCEQEQKGTQREVGKEG